MTHSTTLKPRFSTGSTEYNAILYKLAIILRGRKQEMLQLKSDYFFHLIYVSVHLDLVEYECPGLMDAQLSALNNIYGTLRCVIYLLELEFPDFYTLRERERSNFEHNINHTVLFFDGCHLFSTRELTRKSLKSFSKNISRLGVNNCEL